jgi:hypothetical protein
VNLWACQYDVMLTYEYGNIILWARVLRICFMGMLIYIILHRLCLDNEQNAMINMKNDVVKNIYKLNDKFFFPINFGLEKARSLQLSKFTIWAFVSTVTIRLFNYSITQHLCPLYLSFFFQSIMLLSNHHMT